jgi:hypothetical protein
MIRLNSSLKNQIGAKIRAYHQSLLNPPVSKERDFVNRTVNAFKNFRPPSSGGQSLSTRSANIDRKPIVDFMPFPRPLSPAFPFDKLNEQLEMEITIYPKMKMSDFGLPRFFGDIDLRPFTKTFTVMP